MKPHSADDYLVITGVFFVPDFYPGIMILSFFFDPDTKIQRASSVKHPNSFGLVAFNPFFQQNQLAV